MCDLRMFTNKMLPFTDTVNQTYVELDVCAGRVNTNSMNIDNHPMVLGDLANVNLSGLTGGNVLQYNSGTGFWVPGTGGGGSSSSGTVQSITQGTGLSFSVSPLTVNGTIGLANSGVTPGAYTNLNATINAFGQILTAANGSSNLGTITAISGVLPVLCTPNPITSLGTIGLTTSGVTAGTYTNPSSVIVSTYGLVTGISSGASSVYDFLVIDTATETIGTGGGNNTLVWASGPSYNDGTLFNTANNEALATVAGIYVFDLTLTIQNPSPTSVTVNLISSSYGPFCAIALNPNAIAESHSNTSVIHLSGNIKMNVNDTVVCNVSNAGSTSLSIINKTWTASIV